MNRFSAGLLAVLLAACGGATQHRDPTLSDGPIATPSNAPTQDQARLFADANDAFAVDLWQQLRSSDGNLAVSPASISVALGMTWGGARGRTAEQMSQTMHFGEDARAYHAAAGSVLSTWNDPEREAYQLAVANRLFGEQSYTWQDDFLSLTRNGYGAPLESTDFRGAAEPARLHINSWVSDRTNDRIQDLIPLGALTSDTRMVLTNAVYFQADWASPFDANNTQPRAFHTGATTRRVPTMHQRSHFRYARADGVQLLEMPYAGGELNMLIALPETRDGLDALEADLDAGRLRSWGGALEDQLVSVSLPKFRVDPAEPLALRQTLINMGMRDAFDPDRADFSAMADPAANEGLPLFISAVFHKAFVAVDEEGTEAAAATAVVVAIETSAMVEPAEQVHFTADHPFLFFIRDANSGAVLFMGRVADPS